MPFLRIESEKEGEFAILKARTNAGGHIVLCDFTEEGEGEIGNSQGERGAERFAKDKKREMRDLSSQLPKYAGRKMVENKAANTGPAMEPRKRIEKISAFPVDAMGKGGRPGYKIQPSDQ